MDKSNNPILHSYISNSPIPWSQICVNPLLQHGFLGVVMMIKMAINFTKVIMAISTIFVLCLLIYSHTSNHPKLGACSIQPQT
jgi:hypothetical protein